MNNITKTIYNQIGQKSFYMMGAKNIMNDENNALMFSIRGSKAFNKIKVQLNSMDTYDVTFWKLGGPKTMYAVKREETLNGVYADMLHKLIENKTGLYLTLS